LPGVEWIGMEKKELEAQSRSVDAVIQAVARIDAAEFAAYRGGWPGQVGMALVDAVFSIRARYDASVLPRLRTLKEHHPEISDDLQALVDLGADEVRRVMGSTKTARRHKADCARQPPCSLSRRLCVGLTRFVNMKMPRVTHTRVSEASAR